MEDRETVHQCDDTETRFRTLFEAMTEGVAIHQLLYDDAGRPVDYRILEVNPAYHAHTGIAVAAAVGRLASELYGAPEAPYLDIYSRVVATGEPQAFTAYFEPLDKHFSIKVCRHGTDCFSTIFEDITEHKRMEQVLRESENRYRDILAAIPDLIFRIDADGVFVDYYAPRREELYAPPEAFLGKRAAEVLPPDLAAMTIEHVQRALATGTVQQYEYMLSLAGDQYFEARMIPCEGGHVLALVRNITKRMQAELLLRERDADLAQAQATAHLGRWRQNPVTGTAIWSDELYRIYGVSPRDEPNPDFSFFLSLVHPDDRERVQMTMERALREKKFPDTEYRVVRPDGREIQMFTRGDILCDADGEIRKIIGSSQDVTVWKETEARLRQANAELKSLDEMKTNLLSNVSHELRTPLVSIRGYTELVATGRSGPVTEKQSNQLGIAIRNIDRLLGLINQLLNFSRLELGVEELDLELFDLRRVAEDAVAMVRPKVEGKDINVYTVLPEIEAIVKGDRDKLYQVFANVLDNAAKFTPVGRTIELKMQVTDGAAVTVAITDTGIGISEDEVERIFERFYQTDASVSRLYGGVGIGLAICKDIIDLHGGTIEVASSEGKGTTLSFSLPLDHTGASAAPGPAARGDETSVAPAARLRVLVVDDDRDVAAYYEELLRSAGHRVSVMNNGPSALAELSATAFDLVILDVAMEGMDGLEVCRRIKADPVMAAVDVLLISALVGDDLQARALEYGAVAFLAKPFEEKKFFAAIERCRVPGT